MKLRLSYHATAIVITLIPFIAFPFLGGWVGYVSAPMKEVERVVYVERMVDAYGHEIAMLDSGELELLGIPMLPIPPALDSAVSSTTSKEVLAPVDTSGWETYINTEFGFSIKHPTTYPMSRLNLDYRSPFLDRPGTLYIPTFRLSSKDEPFAFNDIAVFPKMSIDDLALYYLNNYKDNDFKYEFAPIQLGNLSGSKLCVKTCEDHVHLNILEGENYWYVLTNDGANNIERWEIFEFSLLDT